MDGNDEVTIDELDATIEGLHNDLTLFREAIQSYLEHRILHMDCVNV